MIIFIIELFSDGDWRAIESCAFDTAREAAEAAVNAGAMRLPVGAWRITPQHLGLNLDIQA